MHRPPPSIKRKREDVVEETTHPSAELDSAQTQDEETEEITPALDGGAVEEQIAKLLGYSTFQPEQRYWLDTGNLDLNAVFGSRTQGLPYGKIYELSGEEHCLVGSTPIDMPRDLKKYPYGVPLQDLVGTKPFVYAYDSIIKEFVVAQASKIWKVGRKKVYSVKLLPTNPAIRKHKSIGTIAPLYAPFLNPDQEVIGTSDHSFMLTDGSYARIDQLKPGDSLMSLYRRKWFDGGRYTAICHPGKKAMAENRFILRCMQGNKDRRYHGHHKNENRWDNSVNNLEWKEKFLHNSDHAKTRRARGEFLGWEHTGIHPRGMAGKVQTAHQRLRATESNNLRNSRRKAGLPSPWLDKDKLITLIESGFSHVDVAKKYSLTTQYTRRLFKKFGLTAMLNHKVVSVDFVGYQDVYDMTVPGYNNFVANGVVVHNCGKTVAATILAGMAQKEGAGVGYIDLEDSRDKEWAAKLGLDLDATVKVYPKLISGKGKKKKLQDGEELTSSRVLARFGIAPKLQSAEDMFEEAEAGMAILAKQGYVKQFWFLDSIANLQTDMVVEAGLKDQNMRTKLDRAQFLSATLPRWAGLAANYNATIFLLNQLRDKQGFVLGKRQYSPGGRALRHACAIRAEIKRRKGGKVLKNGKTIGIIGTIVNEKNKAGGGSEQNQKCAFKVVWTKTPARITFMSMDEVEADGQ